jgi:hypothetical protein
MHSQGRSENTTEEQIFFIWMNICMKYVKEQNSKHKTSICNYVNVI